MTNGCLHWRISVASCRLLLTALLWLSVATSGVAAEADSNPLQPVDTSSPRSTFLAFRENTEAAYRRWRLREGRMATEVEVRRALRTLDLSRIGEALLEEIGIGDALYLYDTMNRIDLPPLEQIPDAATAKAQNLARWTIPGTEITIAKVEDGERAGEFLFTADSLARARQFFELVQDLPPKRGEGSVIATWRAAPGLGMPDQPGRAGVGSAGLGVLPDPGSAGVEVARGVARHAGHRGLRLARLACWPQVGQAPRQAGCRLADRGTHGLARRHSGAGRPGAVPGARGPATRAPGHRDAPSLSTPSATSCSRGSSPR